MLSHYGDQVDQVVAGRAIFGGHTVKGGAIGKRQTVKTFTEELDELSDHAPLAQPLGHGEYQIGPENKDYSRVRRIS
jgi:hypothetical protein